MTACYYDDKYGYLVVGIGNSYERYLKQMKIPVEDALRMSQREIRKRLNKLINRCKAAERRNHE